MTDRRLVSQEVLLEAMEVVSSRLEVDVARSLLAAVKCLPMTLPPAERVGLLKRFDHLKGSRLAAAHASSTLAAAERAAKEATEAAARETVKVAKKAVAATKKATQKVAEEAVAHAIQLELCEAMRKDGMLLGSLVEAVRQQGGTKVYVDDRSFLATCERCPLVWALLRESVQTDGKRYLKPLIEVQNAMRRMIQAHL